MSQPLQRQGDVESAHRFAKLETLGFSLGIISSVLILFGFFAVDEGGTELSGTPTDIAYNLASLHSRIVVGSMMGIGGAFALLGFGASLRLRLSREGVTGEWLGSLAFASAILMTLGGIVQGSFRIALAAIVNSNVPADEMLQIWRFDRTTDILIWGAVALVGTMCISSFAVDLFARLLGGAGLTLVAATVVLMPTDRGGAGISLLLWLIVACGFLIARNDRADRTYL